MSTSQLSPHIRAALDRLSLVKMPKSNCSTCDGPMVGIDTHLVMYGADQSWTVKLPLCPKCDGKTNGGYAVSMGGLVSFETT